MPYEVDVPAFIEEVRKRPTLWDLRSPEYNDRNNTPQLWQEIADILKTDVETCKRKWKNLRDAYRAEVRRAERRSAMRKANGQEETSPEIKSKWMYFQPLSFLRQTKRVRHSQPHVVFEGNSSSQEHTGYDSDLRSYCDIKMEPLHTTDEDDDENDESDMLLEEFQSITTPQAVRRLSHSISLANAAADEIVGGPIEEPADEKNCKCSKRSDEQVHFLEDLEREERKLMQSTRQDMTRIDTVSHVGDADYNFLVSFLPQMKKMSELQNLQFRAKMSELLLNIMAPSAAANSASNSTTPANVQCPTASNALQQQQQTMQQQKQQQLVPLYTTPAEEESTDGEACDIDKALIVDTSDNGLLDYATAPTTATPSESTTSSWN